MNKLEQIGRYGCMFLMIFNIGILEFSFSSIGMFLFYTVGNVVLLIVYWIIWMLFFQKQDNWKRMVLAIIPTVLFLISGIALRHILLIIMAVIFEEDNDNIIFNLRSSRDCDDCRKLCFIICDESV